MISKNMIFSLQNNEKYMVLDMADYEGKNYLYTVMVDDTLIKSLGKYLFFENKDNMVSKVDDEYLADKLYEVFTNRYLEKWDV